MKLAYNCMIRLYTRDGPYTGISGPIGPTVYYILYRKPHVVLKGYVIRNYRDNGKAL